MQSCELVMPNDATTLVSLEALDARVLEALARITLAAAREHSPDWLADLDDASEQLSEARAPGKVARVVVANGEPIGWVAAAPAWGQIWDLHPLIVAIDHQRRGHGRRLVRTIEQIAAASGALTMTLGTSDTTGATSLAGVDLYEDTFAQLAAMQVRRPHPVSFWVRLGYRITGVIPDAEGRGKPSIQLSRRLAATTTG